MQAMYSFAVVVVIVGDVVAATAVFCLGACVC